MCSSTVYMEQAVCSSLPQACLKSDLIFIVVVVVVVFLNIFIYNFKIQRKMCQLLFSFLVPAGPIV